jgi:hypothetical protein
MTTEILYLVTYKLDSRFYTLPIKAEFPSVAMMKAFVMLDGAMVTGAYRAS